MKKNVAIILIVLAFTACSYMPTYFKIELYVRDVSGNPLIDITCQLLKNGMIEESAVSDIDGLCEFEPIRRKDEAYVSISDFEKQFTISVDGGTSYESKVIAAIFDSSPGGSSRNGGPFIVTLNAR